MRIPERQAELDALVREFLTDLEPNGNGNHRHAPITKTDEEVIEKARSEKNGKFDRLWRGDTSDYDHDHSSADDAFVHKLWPYTQDEEQVYRIHAASGLRRPKSERPDYLRRSINRARKQVTWFYEWPEERSNRRLSSNSANVSADRPRPITTADQARRPAGLAGRVKLGERIAGGIEPPEQLVEGVLYARKVHAFNSEPGEGKTTAALWTVVEVVGQGRPVLYLDAENGPGLVAERLQSLGADVEDLDRFMHYHPSPELTLDADSLTDLATTAEEVGPALVVFDSLPDFLALAGLNENDAGDVTRWILEVVQPLKDRGAAVLLLDHVTKSTEGRGRYARGSGAKLAKCDMVWTLAKTVPFDRDQVGELRLKLRKDRDAFMPRQVNFAVGGTPDGLMFRRAAGVVEVPGVADGLTESQRTALEDLQSRAGEEGLTYSEWKAGTGLADTTFDRARDALIRLGLARRIKQRYHPINPEPPLYPRGGDEGEGSRGGSGGRPQTSEGDTSSHSGGGKKPDTYAESTKPHLPPHNPRGGGGGCVQTRTPTYPHTPLRGVGVSGGWTGGGAVGLSVGEAGNALKSARSGPALSLKNYLESPSPQRLEYLTRAVLFARGMPSEGWELYTAVVEEAAADPRNHPLDCGCEECL